MYCTVSGLRLCVVSSRAIAHCCVYTVNANHPNDERVYMYIMYAHSEAFMLPVRQLCISIHSG